MNVGDHGIAVRSKAIGMLEAGVSQKDDALRSHKNWNTEEWARVVFSDESMFLQYTNDGRAYVRRMKGDESSERCPQNICKFGGGGIMLWGCFCWSGVGLLWKVSENLKTNS
ncbi:hypothetical protein LOD99_889 [Oopsacas minuta]|uniref:Uncharacterized protein n=1 Tax=Oopsacas minuta TaxID=111878 RepID=A0AAV7JZU1_9METZ|nr:hypothetical protein LOD99_889 [Oopsacas minuta]